jgi:hypothetical protein
MQAPRVRTREECAYDPADEVALDDDGGDDGGDDGDDGDDIGNGHHSRDPSRPVTPAMHQPPEPTTTAEKTEPDSGGTTTTRTIGGPSTKGNKVAPAPTPSIDRKGSVKLLIGGGGSSGGDACASIFHYQTDGTFAGLVTEAAARAHTTPGNISLHYEDADGDVCCVENDEHVASALRSFAKLERAPHFEVQVTSSSCCILS